MVNKETLLERAFMCLEDGNFAKADELLEQILNLDPKSAKAHVGKLMVELKICNECDLQYNILPLAENTNYKRAIQFADDGYKEVLLGYNQNILDREEYERKEVIYVCANESKANCKDENEFKNTAEVFRRISGYKDADELAAECDCIADKLRIEAESKAEINRMRRTNGIKYAKKVSPIILTIIILTTIMINVATHSSKYTEAQALMDKKQYAEAITIFSELGNYKDSRKQIKDCRKQIKASIEQEFTNIKSLINDKNYDDADSQLAKIKKNYTENNGNDKEILADITIYKNQIDELKEAEAIASFIPSYVNGLGRFISLLQKQRDRFNESQYYSSIAATADADDLHFAEVSTFPIQVEIPSDSESTKIITQLDDMDKKASEIKNVLIDISSTQNDYKLAFARLNSLIGQYNTFYDNYKK